MAEKRQNIPEYKLEEIKDLVKLIDGNKTVMFASIKGLPAAQFQQIKKSLKGKADVKVIRKRALLRALEGSKKSGVKVLKEEATDSIALLTSDIDAFELSGILEKSKGPVKAKSGQISDIDIEIEAGVTEIPAGPAVSELGNVGLQVKVTDGKIEIMKSKVIVKPGDEISENAASVLGKLDITPFNVGFVPLIAFDSESNILFRDLKVDSEATVNEMKTLLAKSKSFAINLGYTTKDVIGMMLGKANANEQALSRLVKEDAEEKNEETANSETVENVESGETNKDEVSEETNEDISKTENIQKVNSEEDKE